MKIFKEWKQLGELFDILFELAREISSISQSHDSIYWGFGN